MREGGTLYTRQLTLQELLNELKPLIDDLMSYKVLLHDPIRYSNAHRDLHYILSDERNWITLHEIKPGAKSNYALHNLAPKRMEWLEDFYKNEIKG
jgi:hypothetical protein